MCAATIMDIALILKRFEIRREKMVDICGIKTLKNKVSPAVVVDS